MRLDTQYEEFTITEARRYSDGNGWSLSLSGGYGFGCPATDLVTPTPGMKARLYGRGFGWPVRGLEIDGHRIFYRTEQEQHDKAAADAMERELRQKADFEASESDYRTQLAALPEVFQRRFARFEAGNPEFPWRYGWYEIAACKQAVALAEHFKTPERLRAWLDKDAPAKDFNAWDDSLSGNQVGVAKRLAWWLLSEPENVVREHGAMVIIVGCEAYGCTHPTEAAS
jgi:hypothetical protein